MKTAYTEYRVIREDNGEQVRDPSADEQATRHWAEYMRTKGARLVVESRDVSEWRRESAEASRPAICPSTPRVAAPGGTQTEGESS